MSATYIHPKLDAVFDDLHARLGLDPQTLPLSPIRGGRVTVGVSDATAMKLWELHRVVDVVCSISAMINVRRGREGKRQLPFVGIDLSAGAGAYRYQPDHGSCQALIGNPLQLLEAVVRHNLPYRLGLFERDCDVLPLLKTNLSKAISHLDANKYRIELIEGDFTNTASAWISRRVQPWMLGLMIIDVNAVFDSPELLKIAQQPQLKMLDVALHVPATMLKWPERRIAPSTLEQLQAAFSKGAWQVASSRGNYQWTWLYGTNNPNMRVLGERGFAAEESAVGQARFERMRTTAADRHKRAQAGLFDSSFVP